MTCLCCSKDLPQQLQGMDAWQRQLYKQARRCDVRRQATGLAPQAHVDIDWQQQRRAAEGQPCNIQQLDLHFLRSRLRDLNVVQET